MERPVIRYYKGQKKKRGKGETAPWDGSLYEKESQVQSKASEYSDTFHKKPGNHQTEAIVPGHDNRSWMIGNINENMDCGTTNAEAYPKKEIDNQIYYRPREMGVIYNTAGDTKTHMTTHDVDYHQEKFGKKEVLSKKEEDINSNESTMKRDFTQKVLTETAKPFRPPVGLGRTILGTENVNEMLSSNRHDYVGNKFERREPVKNCKPIRNYERPTIAMECTTTTQSQFTHHQCLPSEPFRPSDNIQ